MKIKGKILISFTGVLSIVIIIFLISVIILTKNITLTESVQNINFPRAMSFMELQKEVLQIHNGLISAANSRGGQGYNLSIAEAEKYYALTVKLTDQLTQQCSDDAEILNNLKSFKKILDEYYSIGKQMANDYLTRGTDAGNLAMYNFEITSDKLLTSMMFSVDVQKKKLEENIQNVNDRTKFVQLFFIITGIVITGLSIFSAFIMSNIIVKPLNILHARLKDIATGEGDLTARVVIDTRDELYDISLYFNQFVEKIQTVIANIYSIANELVSSSQMLSSASSAFSENTQGEAASVEEITATIEEISSGMENISDNTVKQYGSLTSLMEKMDELTRIIREMGIVTVESTLQTQRINEFAKTGKETLTRMSTTIQKIESSSKEMKNIISIISDISDKINLLSLNAAIESARAGDAGRGFAVVADEISKLADQTARSINSIDSLIKINNEEIGAGMNNVTESINKIQIIIDGVIVIDQMMVKIKDLMKNQTDMNDIVSSEAGRVKILSDEIKNATNEQKTASSEIVKSISTINDLIQTNAGGAVEVAGTSEKVASIAETLKQKVDFFKI